MNHQLILRSAMKNITKKIGCFELYLLLSVLADINAFNDPIAFAKSVNYFVENNFIQTGTKTVDTINTAPIYNIFTK